MLAEGLANAAPVDLQSTITAAWERCKSLGILH
jgi:hypothetical protein